MISVVSAKSWLRTLSSVRATVLALLKIGMTTETRSLDCAAVRIEDRRLVCSGTCTALHRLQHRYRWGAQLLQVWERGFQSGVRNESARTVARLLLLLRLQADVGQLRRGIGA